MQRFAPLWIATAFALDARVPVLRYESRWVAVNKPCGISTHRARDTGRRRVLTTQLQRQFRRKVFTVHRLDHRTSGCIIFGFDGEEARTGARREGAPRRASRMQHFSRRASRMQHSPDARSRMQPLSLDARR